MADVSDERELNSDALLREPRRVRDTAAAAFADGLSHHLPGAVGFLLYGGLATAFGTYAHFVWGWSTRGFSLSAAAPAVVAFLLHRFHA